MIKAGPRDSSGSTARIRFNPADGGRLRVGAVSFLRCMLWLALLFEVTSVSAESLAARVIVLANSADPASIELARYYAQRRDVPSHNVIALPLPQSETIGWSEFVTSIWNPVRAQLVQQKWIDAIPMDLTDGAGRKKYSVAGHLITYLVVCRGVPLRIRHEPTLYHAAPPMTDNAIFRTNAAAVDGELALLAQDNPEITAYLSNPLFGNDDPSRIELRSVIKVSRLDGPTAADAQGLVDWAIEAERNGVEGRAYVDIGGIHPDGDRWLEGVVRILAELRIETEVDRAPSTFAATTPFQDPLLYFGWYAATINGPFTRPDFRFRPGAVAMHIHSYSATSLRDPNHGWSGPLVARGATATVGNVFEPYLQLTHRPDLLLRSLARGENFGDAACYAQRALSWQTVAIGDPLYRPFPTHRQLDQRR